MNFKYVRLHYISEEDTFAVYLTEDGGETWGLSCEAQLSKAPGADEAFMIPFTVMTTLLDAMEQYNYAYWGRTSGGRL